MSTSNLKYIRFKNFRNFGEEPVTLTFESKINLIIGRNNIGKSNVLRVLKFLSDLANNSLFSVHYQDSKQLPFLVDLDNHHLLKNSTPIEVEICVEPSPELRERIKALKDRELFIVYEITHGEPAHIITHKRNFFNDINEADFAEQYQLYLTEINNHEAASYEQQVMRMTHHYFITSEIQRSFPKVEYVNEVRAIDDSLVKKIYDIVYYDYRNKTNQVKRDGLYAYFKTVFGYDVKVVVFPFDNNKPANKKIELVVGNDQYPLGSLGSGLEQIVIIAFYIISANADLLCIDEPEMHLHAAAQRALLNMMSTIIDKQFFLATHSNHFLDYEVIDKNVFQISNQDGISNILKTVQLSSLYSILDDLGVRASEIYQANGIIWVEGPSDRIYIKRWLELRHPNLKEGLQFTFQFYGGKILSHYSVSDEEFTDYLNLLIINTNCFIVIDSDMTKLYTDEELRETKQRVVRECVANNIKFWITKGKEIENYLSEEVLSEVSGTSVVRDVYQDIKNYCSKFDRHKKVAFAHQITGLMTVTEFQSNEDLREKIDLIAQQIEFWNK